MLVLIPRYAAPTLLVIDGEKLLSKGRNENQQLNEGPNSRMATRHSFFGFLPSVFLSSRESAQLRIRGFLSWKADFVHKSIHQQSKKLKMYEGLRKLRQPMLLIGVSYFLLPSRARQLRAECTEPLHRSSGTGTIACVTASGPGDVTATSLIVSWSSLRREARLWRWERRVGIQPQEDKATAPVKGEWGAGVIINRVGNCGKYRSTSSVLCTKLPSPLL